MCPLRDHAPIVNVVGHRFPVSGLDGALMPHGRLIYPIVVTRRIGLGLLSTDGSLGYALIALYIDVTDQFIFGQASVAVLSIICR